MNDELYSATDRDIINRLAGRHETAIDGGSTEYRMGGLEIKGHLVMVGHIARVSLSIPTNELLAAFSHNDAVGPVLDPTAWMATRDNAHKNERLVRALADFQKVVREVYPELEGTP